MKVAEIVGQDLLLTVELGNLTRQEKQPIYSSDSPLLKSNAHLLVHQFD